MKPRKERCGNDLLDFVHNVRQLAKQALGKHAGEPESGGLPHWVHVAIHCIRIQENRTYTRVIDRLGLMPGVCEVLGLLLEALSDPTALWYSFQRYKMWVWRQLLRVSAQQLGHSGDVALDNTSFNRGHVSQCYRKRTDRDIQTMKVTTLTNVDSLAVHDVYCSVKYYTLDVDPLIPTPYRIFNRALRTIMEVDQKISVPRHERIYTKNAHLRRGAYRSCRTERNIVSA